MVLQCHLIQSRRRIAYRGELSIVETILQVVSEGGAIGKNASKIVTASGLIYCDTIKKCEKLIEAGFLESWREGRLLLFRITPKGLKFLSAVKDLLDLAKSANLRC